MIPNIAGKELYNKRLINLEKESIFAIDTARRNLGSVLTDFDKTPSYADRTTLQLTGDGRFYKQYEEGISTELCINYLRDRWKFIEQAGLVVIEKAMVKRHDKFVRDPTEGERAAVVIERTLYSILWSYYSLGYGPAVIVVTPTWWQQVNGIPPMSYEAHKKKSCDMFRAIVGNPFTEMIESHYIDRKFDDIAEAYLIARAVFIRADFIKKEFEVNSNHSAKFDELGKNVMRESRVLGDITLLEGGTYTDPKYRKHWLYTCEKYYDSKPAAAKLNKNKFPVLAPIDSQPAKETKQKQPNKKDEDEEEMPVKKKKKKSKKVIVIDSDEDLEF